MTRTKKITLLGLLSALAMVLSYVEMLLPPIIISIPGIKVGLPNIITVFLLYKFSFKDAFLVSLIRIFVISLLFGNIMTMSYSLAGGITSILLMFLLKKTNLFSTVGVSIAGGVAHNLGQIIVAIFITNTLQIGYYMISLFISGTVAGAVIGIIGSLTLKYTKNLIGNNITNKK